MILWRAGYPGDDNGDDDVDVNDDGDDDCFDAPCVLKGLKRQRLMGGWGTDSLLLLLLLPYNDDLEDGDVDGGGDDDDCVGAMSYPIYIFQLMQLKMMSLLPSVGQYYIFCNEDTFGGQSKCKIDVDFV